VESTFKSPHGVDAHTHVLKIPLTASHQHCIQEEPTISSIEFGSIQTEHGFVMSIKLHLDGTQVIVLADLCDPDVWSAILRWKRVKVVPVVFGTEHGSEWKYRFAIVKMPPGELEIEPLARLHFPKVSEGLWDDMTALAEANTWLDSEDCRSEKGDVRNSIAFPHPRPFTFMGMFSEKMSRSVW
jgi:hypothetical protein